MSATIMEAILQLRRAVGASTFDLPLGLAVILSEEAGRALLRESERMMVPSTPMAPFGDGMLKVEVAGIPVVWPGDRHRAGTAAAEVAEALAAGASYRRMRDSMEAGR